MPSDPADADAASPFAGKHPAAGEREPAPQEAEALTLDQAPSETLPGPAPAATPPTARPGKAPRKGTPDLKDQILKARDGDLRAAEAIIHAFEVQVLRLARHMLRDPSDAEDVAQEVFLRLFSHVGRLDPGRDPAGWVVRVTINQCWDFLKRRRRRAEEPLAHAGEIEGSLMGPAEATWQAEQKRILRDSLTVLSPRERAVFILHEVEGEDVARIGQELRLSRITVRRHLSRARRRLRSHLARLRPELL